MAKGGWGKILQGVRELLDEGTLGGLSDGELLARYVARVGDSAESAFAALVERHGPMVLRVCRNVLRDEHGAEDAFQATFLILARRADSLWVRGTLGPWLYGVAYRTSSCARSASARRRSHERKAGRGRLMWSRNPDGMTSARPSTRSWMGCPSGIARRSSCAIWRG